MLHMAKFCSRDVEELKSKLSSEAQTVLEGDDRYDELSRRWSAAAEKRASIIVLPTSTADVSRALQFAQDFKLDLAVKGGGHATCASSSTNGGLCIDLSLMRDVSVDTKRQTIRAAGGALWRDVYEAGESVGLACVGGAVDETGVGGLTLGGGYGYMSGAHGLVIDNLLEVEYVLANGTTVIASERENPDLFWAARGAGAGFGVATSFLYQAHPQTAPVWGGLLVFTAEQLGDVIEAGNDFIGLNDEKGSLVVSVTTPPPTHTVVVLALIYYNGTEQEAQKAFTKLLQLKPMANTLGLISYPSINQLFSGGATVHGMRHSMKGAAFYFPLQPSFAKKLLEELSSFVSKVPDASSSLIAFEFFPHNKIASVPLTATAFANRGPYGNLVSIMGWRESVNDERCRQFSRDISEMSKKVFFSIIRSKDGEEDNNRGVGEYFNYDGLRTCGKSVFGINFSRLVKIKNQYDPKNLFNKGPKLIETSS
ncbi:6-hydroxy-D-nicotine oxidase [Golovinomyces cichoracearum]|uniref:6-hydroxy-D-nicotine oxidase n=1 Tax=Golovinomyces cichoracearum TaxID=62708 RepID=A0A420H844_9PEZI|nr:6-hydroxy-D-nicotine oxidase [Golovinomyces cichoracearum]